MSKEETSLWVFLPAEGEEGWKFDSDAPFSVWFQGKAPEPLHSVEGFSGDAVVVNPCWIGDKVQELKTLLNGLPLRSRIWIHVGGVSLSQIKLDDLREGLNEFGLCENAVKQAVPYSVHSGGEEEWNTLVLSIKGEQNKGTLFHFHEKLEEAWRAAHHKYHRTVPRQQVLEDLFSVYIDVCGLLECPPEKRPYRQEVVQALKELLSGTPDYPEKTEIDEDMKGQLAGMWEQLPLLTDLPATSQKFKRWFEQLSQSDEDSYDTARAPSLV